LGSAGFVTAISSLVLTFVGTTGTSGRLIRFGSIALGLLLIWALSKSRWLNRYLSILINWALNRWTRLDVRDYSNLLHLSGEYQVSELQVEDAEDWLANRHLSELRLRDEGIAVLGIQRQDGNYIGAPKGDTCIYPGDRLILYGRAKNLTELDARQADQAGEAAHQDAMAEQRRVLSKQEQDDRQGQKPKTS
jgi:hypothetical protein